MKVEEKLFECDVKKLFLRNRQKRWEWVTRPVATAIADGVTEFRCKDCHGPVRLYGKRAQQNGPPHVVHKLREDSEFCPAGAYFRENPGREPRMSSEPVK